MGTRKDALHHQLLKKCKSKVQWGITSHWSKWLSSKCLQIINTRESREKGTLLYCWGNVNWCSHYGKQCGDSLKILKIGLPYDLAILLLGIYLEKTLIQKDTCILVFIAALFTIAKTWKQPKCPSTDEWIKKMWCLCWIQLNIEYYSVIKRIKCWLLQEHGWTWKVIILRK